MKYPILQALVALMLGLRQISEALDFEVVRLECGQLVAMVNACCAARGSFRRLLQAPDRADRAFVVRA